MSTSTRAAVVVCAIACGSGALLYSARSTIETEAPDERANAIAPDQPAPRVPTMVRCDESATASAVEYARRQLGDLLHTEDDIGSAGKALDAFLGAVALGDAGSYVRFYEEAGGVMSPRAQFIAEQDYKRDGLAGVDDQAWSTLDDREKFIAVASEPERRNASVVKIDPRPIDLGLGLPPPIGRGNRIHGMRSVFDPPSTDMLHPGANPEILWIRYWVDTPHAEKAELRVELLFDPAVRQWLPIRGGLVADADAEVPWIRF